MSIAYKFFDFGIRAANAKHFFDMPEDEFLEYLRRTQHPLDIPGQIYRSFDVSKSEFSGRLFFEIKPRGTRPKKTILFLHGGGGLFAPMKLHYKMAGNLVKRTGAELILPFYPLAPESNARESAEWVKEFYTRITETRGAKSITVIGDSAGAFLAARLVSAVSDKPAGAVLISPVTGVDKHDGAAMSARHNDVILSERVIDMAGKYCGEGIPLDSPDFNAEYIDYRGFPPVVLYYGTNEMFAPHMDKLTANIKKHAPIEIHRGVGMCHDWAISSAFPEGRMALRRICNFVCRG